MKFGSVRRAVCADLIVLAALVTPTYSQDTTGTVMGTLVDQAGDALAAATVTLTNIDTGERHQVVTNGAGQYSARLSVGRYDISFLLSNVEPFIARGLSLGGTDRLQINAKLSIGPIETLTMTTERLVSAVENLGQLLHIQEQPLLTSAFGQLVTLVPGVPSDLHEDACFCDHQTLRLSIRGPRRSVVNSLFDAASNANGWINSTLGSSPAAGRIDEDKGNSTGLINLGVQLILAGDPTAAKPIFERALAIRETVFGPDHMAVASTLDAFGGLLLTLHDDDRAKAVLERALRIREAAYPRAHPDTLRTLVNLAIVHQLTADYAGARRHYDGVLAMADAISEPVDAPLLNALGGAAMVLQELRGDYWSAARLNERLLALVEHAFGSTDRRLWTPLDNLAIDLREVGDYSAARAKAERAVALADRAFGPNSPEVAKSLHTLATVLAGLGEYADGMRSMERATRINEQFLLPSDRDVSRAIWFIPNLLPLDVPPLMGFSSLSDARFQGLTALGRRNGGLVGPQTDEVFANLAAALSSPADYSMTRPLFEMALMSKEELLGPDHPEVAIAASNLAYVLAHIGETGRMTALYARALGIWEKSLGPDHPQVAAALRNLGRVQLERGNYDTARALVTRALTIQEEKLGPEHPELAATLGTLAELNAQQGIATEAFDAAARATDIWREHIRLTVRALPEHQALTYASAGGSGIELMLSIASNQASDTESVATAWNAVIRTRGMVFDEMAARHGLVSTIENSEVIALTQELTSARQRLAATVIRGPGHAASERYRAQLDQARQDKDRLERELADKSARFREDLSKDHVDLSTISAALPDDTALVGFVRFRRRSFESTTDAKARSEADGELCYLAFVMRGGSPPAVVVLGKAARIDGLISRWRRQLDQQAIAGGSGSRLTEAAYRRVAAQLREQIWDPLRSHLANTPRVFVVPDGALHLVNFATMPEGTSKYLVETGPLIHYISTERDVVSIKPAAPAGLGLLALGGVAFDAASRTTPSGDDAHYRGARSNCLDFQSMRFDPLPDSLNEVSQIVSLWNRTHAESRTAAGQPDTIRLTGTDASEAAVKSEAAGRRILHLATHGFFLGNECARAPDPTPTGAPTNAPTRTAKENPLLLSGLVLAGANRRNAATADQEDGVLTAEEVATLNLRSVEWAVLSGCDTGAGELKAGEGVFGLQRAFLVAGARTVIMSLWPVEDRATREWMRILYEGRLLKHLGTAEAVQHASLGALRQRRASGLTTHPFYWGGFVATGDWR